MMVSGTSLKVSDECLVVPCAYLVVSYAFLVVSWGVWCMSDSVWWCLAHVSCRTYQDRQEKTNLAHLILELAFLLFLVLVLLVF